MRFLRLFALVALAICLSGCFIQQEAPQPQPVDQIKAQGVVSLLELRFLNQGAAAVLAGFNKIVPDSPSREEILAPMDIHVFDRAAVAPWSQFGFIDPRSVTRGATCKKFVQARPDGTARGATTRAVGDAISLGQIQFGLDHQNTLTTMAEDAAYNYGLSLNPPVPAGDYQISAEGNQALGIGGFKVGFTMPEAITGIRLDGNYIDRSGVEFSRHEPLKIEWDAPSVPNDMNALGLELISEDVTTRHILICVGLEKEVASFDAHGQPSWSIDPSWLSDLFDGDGTQVYVTREILNSAEGGGLHLDLEGVRKWMSVAIVR